MIRDRGAIKWTAMMLPEHVHSIKEALKEDKKITQPILDEDQIREMELLILESMEYGWVLECEMFKNGEIRRISGHVVHIDHLKQEIRIQDTKDSLHTIPFRSLVNIQKD
ncbi:YolD-like family protein [Niallia circulans]|uniref:YolD-like family protein n=1 Tax=Niallia circulans TaxID=1397 RepID=A0A553SNA0_NIACI|nr:YolD-like family protein [Niallia circulans]TRZ38470.1 YolD-like family protein [Niallia circulans]